MSSENAILECVDVRRYFQGVKAVDGASFRSMEGRITGLIGPNGAGKSTMMSIAAGSLKPDSGAIRFKGEDITGLESHNIATKGLIRTFQLASEFTNMTVLENLMTAPQNQIGESLMTALFHRKKWKRQEEMFFEKAWELLRQFELDHVADEYAGNLSGGQKRLLELSRALMADPSMLMLDEPMSGVNPSLADELAARLQALKEQGLSMLIVEHDLGIVERLCDEVIVMAQGTVLAVGTLDALKEDERVVEAYLS